METNENPIHSMQPLMIKGDDSRDPHEQALNLSRPMSLTSLLDVDFSTMSSYVVNDELLGPLNGYQTGSIISGNGSSSTEKMQPQTMEPTYLNMNQNLLYLQRNFT